ncbi:MAG: GNAT family N-acetyltransferase [Pseudomonadota bacterium]
MMQVIFQTDPRDFLGRCGAHLEQNEAEHSLILSLCQDALQKQRQGRRPDIFFSSLFDNDEFVVAAVQTPARNLVLSKSGQPEIEKLAEILACRNRRFPGIVGPSDVASGFASKWTQITGQKPVEYVNQIVYTLKEVLLPPLAEGGFRLAGPEDTGAVAAWISSFAREALPKADQVSGENAFKKADDLVREGRAAVWVVKGAPVSMATVSGTDSVARLGGVYTPPEWRGRGYAGATVAHLSHLQLDRGKKMCCLYADARNPASNSIYRKIGYEFVGRSSLYVLESESLKEGFIEDARREAA